VSHVQNGKLGGGTQDKEGGAYLEIVEEEGEFMPRAGQTQDTSADGRWQLTRFRRGVLTSTQLPRGGVRQRWRFADTIRRGFSKCQEKKWMYRTIELPTQIPIVSSILSFIAIHTDVTCSAALACTTSQVKVPKGSVGHTHDDGKENKTDERFWDIEPLCCLLDRRDH
jgi:hypothetical protein